VRRVCLICCLTAAAFALNAASVPTGASVATALRQLSINSNETYHVRDLHLSRGGVSIYLTDGILSFATPVCGRRMAAVFTTSEVEAGDAEILLMPPRASERASLASFAKTPNLDEHFSSALFLFSDDTAQELLAQIGDSPIHKAPDQAAALGAGADQLFRSAAAELEVQIVHALLGGVKTSQGFFYAAFLGRTAGTFDFLYEPRDFEPVTLGRTILAGGHPEFQLWTAFRPPHAPPYREPAPAIAAYRLNTTIHDDLSMSVEAQLKLTVPPDSGRVLRFEMSDRLNVLSAAVDGKPVEVFQRPQVRTAVLSGEGAFLLIADGPFTPGSEHSVDIQYEGSVIRQMADGGYAVADRTTWYPFMTPTLATFDLTFRCPESLHFVSTGELVSDQVSDGERVVHRKTPVPEHIAGFNLGDYQVAVDEHGRYRVACYANAAMQGSGGETPLAGLVERTENILDDYTRRWGPLPIHSIAISPVPGYFGQGFPGLIYLSAVSYVPLEKRPPAMRGPRQDSFFSDLLLPHEVSHQWWGNIVRSANYRTAWLIEAMAEDSALQYLQSTKDMDAVDAVLERYRSDLTSERNGKPVDSAGPLDFGLRLLNTAGLTEWETITYEKGAWVLHMLRGRLGNDGFHKLQLAMLAQYADKPITNEDFRRLASRFVPAGEDDPSLTDFFDAWVYGTGIPSLQMHGSGRSASLDLSGVDDEFTADVPLACKSKQGRSEMRWVRASSGANTLNLPVGESCALPAPATFLYSQ
jgi:hypothetical protein